MHGSIWNIDPESGIAYEITYSEDAYHSSPDYSPDGRWLVFTADYDHQRIQLEVLDTESGEISKLTDDQAVYTDPVFSPDGSKIAVMTQRDGGHGNMEIFVMDADGSRQMKLTNLGKMSWAPFFHPSGEYLIFSTNVHGFQNLPCQCIR